MVSREVPWLRLKRGVDGEMEAMLLSSLLTLPLLLLVLSLQLSQRLLLLVLVLSRSLLRPSARSVSNARGKFCALNGTGDPLCTAVAI